MDTESSSEYAEIAESVRSGEYFRRARGMYDLMAHDSMADRYLYLFITAIAMLCLLVAVVAMRSLYPLKPSVPFIFSSTNIAEDLPHIDSLLARERENPSEALLRFLMRNYVIMRESYDIDTFDSNLNGVKSQSSPSVFNELQQAIDPRNPGSPITLYQRHSKRMITILSSRRLEQADQMEVVYEAAVESHGEVKKSRWQANIAFQYSGLTLDEKTGKVKPISFTVTQYYTKRL